MSDQSCPETMWSDGTPVTGADLKFPVWTTPIADLARWPLGPELHEVCDRCNFDSHQCPGCGEELTHAEWVRGDHFRTHFEDGDA